MRKKDVIRVIGCHPSTVKRYVEKGYIKAVKLPNGRYNYDEESVYAMVGKRIPKENKIVAYCRVNKDTIKGREKLQEQKQLVNLWAIKRGITIDEVYEDLSTGTNAYRKGFNSLLESIFKKEISTVIIHTKCRLVRFSFYTMRMMFRYHGVKIEIISPAIEDPFYLDEQTDDIAKMLSDARVERISED